MFAKKRHKKRSASLLPMLAAVIVIAIPSAALAQAGFSLSVPGTVEEGGTFGAVLQLDVGGDTLSSYDIELSFDPVVLELTGLEGGTTSGFDHAPTYHNDTPVPSFGGSSLRFSAVTLVVPAPTLDVNVARIAFQAVGSAGDFSDIAIEAIRVQNGSVPTEALGMQDFTPVRVTIAGDSIEGEEGEEPGPEAETPSEGEEGEEPGPEAETPPEGEEGEQVVTEEEAAALSADLLANSGFSQYVTLEEAQALNQELTRQEFESLDGNSDGELDAVELTAHVFVFNFLTLDANSDGYLSPFEAAQVEVPVTQEVFDELDANGDGDLAIEELLLVINVEEGEVPLPEEGEEGEEPTPQEAEDPYWEGEGPVQREGEAEEGEPEEGEGPAPQEGESEEGEGPAPQEGESEEGEGPAPSEEYTLTLAVEGEGTLVPEPGEHTYYSGDEVTISAAPAEGWLLESWVGDVPETDFEGESADSETEKSKVEAETVPLSITITMDGNKSVTAVFAEAPKKAVFACGIDKTSAGTASRSHAALLFAVALMLALATRYYTFRNQT